MKTLTLLSVLLLAACGSSSSFGIADEKTHTDCEHGGVQVGIGLSGPGSTNERFDNRMMITVLVNNNSREDIVVKAIRVEQTNRDMSDYQVEDTYRAFNETITEDDDHVFELPTQARSQFVAGRQSLTADALHFAVSVYLEDESYRCTFAVPVRSR